MLKLLDGKCWMTSNLNLVGSKTLYSSDSNVTSNWTLPASSNTNWNNDYGAFVHKSTNPLYPGVYYSWVAVTAGTGNQYMSKGTNATGSVCPKGWRLPTGGDTSSKNDYIAMSDAYGGGTDASAISKFLSPAIPNLQFSGAYEAGSEQGQGTVVRYWTSTAYNLLNGRYDAYAPAINATGLFFQNLSAMYRGNMVRCIVSN